MGRERDGGAGGQDFVSTFSQHPADGRRDRINYSRAMLKRFIRDCVARDAAIFSPWIVKKPIALRYGLPTEMTDERRAVIAALREAQMDRRKRDREERLGIAHDDETESEQPAKKKRTSKGLSKEDRERIKQEEKEAEEKEQEEVKKKVSRGIKYPIEGELADIGEADIRLPARVPGEGQGGGPDRGQARAQPRPAVWRAL